MNHEPHNTDPFHDDYEPKLMWFRSYNERPPHSSREIRLRIPESTYNAIKAYLVGRPQTAWIDPQSLIRPAVYHGLHHLGEILHTEDLMHIASQYKAAVRAERRRAELEQTEKMLADFRENERNARTQKQIDGVVRDLEEAIRDEDDREIREQLLAQLARMK